MKKDTKEIIDYIKGTMLLEGISLDDEFIEKLRKCIEEESNIDLEIKNIINQYRNKE